MVISIEDIILLQIMCLANVSLFAISFEYYFKVVFINEILFYIGSKHSIIVPLLGFLTTLYL